MELGTRVKVQNTYQFDGRTGVLGPNSGDPEDPWSFTVKLDGGHTIAVRKDQVVRADAVVCPRHGGEWGEDMTCPKCTDLDGNPRAVPNVLCPDCKGLGDDRGSSGYCNGCNGSGRVRTNG